MHLLQPAGPSPGAARVGGDVCSRGLLAGAKAMNKSVQYATLVVLLFQTSATNSSFCVTCGFLVPPQSLRRLLLTDVLYLQLGCGS